MRADQDPSGCSDRSCWITAGGGTSGPILAGDYAAERRAAGEEEEEVAVVATGAVNAAIRSEDTKR